jgi:hypothetical protein
MTETPVSPLRRRMIEDMTIRKFAPRTHERYIRAVRSFSAFLLGRRRTRRASRICAGGGRVFWINWLCHRGASKLCAASTNLMTMASAVLFER